MVFATHSADTTTVDIAARVGMMNVLAVTTIKPLSLPGPSITAAKASRGDGRTPILVAIEKTEEDKPRLRGH